MSYVGQQIKFSWSSRISYQENITDWKNTLVCPQYVLKHINYIERSQCYPGKNPQNKFLPQFARSGIVTGVLNIVAKTLKNKKTKLNSTLISWVITNEPTIRKLRQNHVKNGALLICHNTYIQTIGEIIMTPSAFCLSNLSVPNATEMRRKTQK